MIYKPRYTVDDYESWAGDWELWQGTAIAMTPSSFGRHQFVLVNLVSELRDALKATDWKVLAEIDWRVDEITVVRPDVVVIEGEVPDRHVIESPKMVVEIVSESTEHKDRTAKYELYQRQGVTNYLIVDPNLRTLDFFTLDENGRYSPAGIQNDCWVFHGPHTKPISIPTVRLFE